MNYPFKFALILSFSLTASSSYYYPPKSRFHSISIRKKPTTTATASAGDILSLLGTPQQASSVDPYIASQLQSCFKFLVPFTPTPTTTHSLTDFQIRFPRRILNSKHPSDLVSHENELIWSPPASVLDIARLAFDSGGDPASIQRTLDPTIINVPFFFSFLHFFY